ncbi:hypothetical protein [Paludisphaera soli]|uniref:hypothetical protein n=1 Tax=Paludisphaera soli TaxID=2712865 RepID=UPI0013EDBA97|nr:hypothetical protein [Paludisphaera soli]
MKWIPAWLVLIAATTGTPLRQSEACGDFARLNVEPPRSAGLEAPDGGVGDDADLGVPADAPAVSDEAAAPHFLPPSPVASTLAGPARRCDRDGPPPDPPPRRRSRLQVFLF